MVCALSVLYVKLNTNSLVVLRHVMPQERKIIMGKNLIEREEKRREKKKF